MKRNVLLAIFLISIFILPVLNVHAEVELEHKNEDYELLGSITVGKYNADYKSIQEAIDNAESGSTIYVKTGTYSEIISINKKISLIGENKENTIINPTSTRNSYALRIRISGVKISGFSINNKGPGLYTTGFKISAPKTTIENCNFYDTPIGIAVWTSKNTISNCKFWGCEDEGIALLGSISNECNNNEITNCEFYDNCDGIELQYSSGNTISDCIFYDNSHCGIDAIGSSNNENLITNCKIYDNEAYGIYLSRSSYNQILDCSFSNNDDGNVIMTAGSVNNEINSQESQNEVQTNSHNNFRNRIQYFLSFFRNSKMRLINFFDAIY